MHKKMLAASPALAPEQLVAYAAGLGLDSARFKSDLAADWTARYVERDVELARSIDIYQTPTYLINGRVVVGERELEYLKKVIDEELALAGGGK